MTISKRIEEQKKVRLIMKTVSIDENRLSFLEGRKLSILDVFAELRFFLSGGGEVVTRVNIIFYLLQYLYLLFLETKTT